MNNTNLYKTFTTLSFLPQVLIHILIRFINRISRGQLNWLLLIYVFCVEQLLYGDNSLRRGFRASKYGQLRILIYKPTTQQIRFL